MPNRKHRVAVSGTQLDAALIAASDFAATNSDRRATSARYDAHADRVVMELADGIQVSIPRAYLQGLEAATATQLGEIELLGNGTGLHWPQLDFDHYVPGLLNNIFGTARWMAQLGRLGGSSRPAKRNAASTNGRKGGRPRVSA